MKDLKKFSEQQKKEREQDKKEKDTFITGALGDNLKDAADLGYTVPSIDIDEEADAKEREDFRKNAPPSDDAEEEDDESPDDDDEE